MGTGLVHQINKPFLGVFRLNRGSLILIILWTWFDERHINLAQRQGLVCPVHCKCCYGGVCTTKTKWAESDKYELRVIDNFPESRFDLILKSNSQKQLCLTREQWPNRHGQLHMGSTIAKVQTGTGVYLALDENFGYCPASLLGCDYHRIDPYGELRGYIAYEAFRDHEALAADPNTQLEFSVYPFYCR